MKPSPSPPAVNRLLFIAASGFSDPEERRAFLEFSCRGDEDRLRRLEVLLDARRDAEEFFDVRPEVGEAVTSGDEGGLGARIGPYRLIDRLGSGGCGVVYLAEQEEPVKRKVALKIIRLGMDTENVIARFAAEREALALMDHPNIARVLDAGATASGRPYFVMELVDGEKITDFCDHQRLGLRQRLELFIQVCDAIQHAHQKGVIHRDIKPSNVLVRNRDGRLTIKVIDFGIAKATAGNLEFDATQTRSGNFLGTPAYMSPEQAAGGVDIDTRSDIYSLGALLCELLIGQPPFRHDRFKDLGVEGIRAIVCDEEPGLPSAHLQVLPGKELDKIASLRAVDPQRLCAQLAGDLDWIVMKAVDKDRKRRYETANGLAMDVQRYLKEEPVLASPPSRRYLLMKLVRRNRIVFAAAAVALFGLLSGLGVSTWLFLREREAREEQARLRIEAEVARANEVSLRERTKTTDLIAQAAVLLRYNEFEQADALLSGVHVDRVPLSLEAAATLKVVADWNLEQHRWQAATDRFRALVPVITSVDLKDTDEMSRILMPAAAAIKTWGRPEDYQQLRKLTIRRFADSSNDGVAAQVIKAVLLEPASNDTLTAIQPLSAVLESALNGPELSKNHYLSAWRQFSMALLKYRQGDLEQAESWALRSLQPPEIPGSLPASNRIILAIVHFQKGRVEQAHKELETALASIEGWESLPFRVGVSTDFWFDWENARILYKEAAQLMNTLPK